MARKTSAPVTIIQRPEPTHEELLTKANEEAAFHFNDMKQRSETTLIGIRERLMDPKRLISNEITWVANDLLQAEVRAEMVRYFEGMTAPTADKQRTPWEAAVYIYRDIQSRIIEQLGYGGQSITPTCTEPVTNGMAIHRSAALSHALRFDLSFVKYYAKKIDTNLFFDAED